MKQPSLSFEHTGLAPATVEKLQENGIKAPTPIQAHVIPALLAGLDAVIVSPTGTGKTLAYLLPILQRLDADRRQTQAIVLAPTQELAMQIVREAERYGAVFGVKTTALIGGASLSRQLERMKAKPALVVGTPGRVQEVASRGKLKLSAVRHVVVDETDRVFMLGGRDDVETILRQCARNRQTVFVSATRPAQMREAERKWLANPWTPEQAGDETKVRSGAHIGSGLPDTIRHWYFIADRRDKIDLVRRLLRHARMKPALLFLNDIDKIGILTAKLTYEGFRVETLYGDIAGQERGNAMQRFRSGRVDLLIATDVAARGIDVPGLPLVIQFDPPLDADHYVHRAGRTGRMGREGVSVTIVTVQQQFIIDKLQKQLGLQLEPKTMYEGRIVSPEEAAAARKRNRAVAARTEEAARTAGSPVPGQADQSTRPARPRQPANEAAALNAPLPPLRPDSARQPAARKSRKTERERDRKNKGAPRWLKRKRESGQTSSDNELSNK